MGSQKSEWAQEIAALQHSIHREAPVMPRSNMGNARYADKTCTAMHVFDAWGAPRSGGEMPVGLPGHRLPAWIVLQCGIICRPNAAPARLQLLRRCLIPVMVAR
jgi:hypothetical protein